jgi:hypothetical protein
MEDYGSEWITVWIAAYRALAQVGGGRREKRAKEEITREEKKEGRSEGQAEGGRKGEGTEGREDGGIGDSFSDFKSCIRK